MASSPLVAFVIPLVAKANCTAWNEVIARLQGTLASIYNQSCEDYRVLIVANEDPDLRVDEKSTTVLTLNLALKRDSLGALSLDKERKMHHGLLHLRSDPPKYVMFLDADDLVSRHLVAFVAENETSDAFLVEHGYVHEEGSRWIQPTRGFYLRCGSGYVFRYRGRETPVDEHYDWERYWMLRAHNKQVLDCFRRYGYRYLAFPFPAAIYVRGHRDSIRARYRAGRDPKSFIALSKRALKYFLYSRPITADIRREFAGL